MSHIEKSLDVDGDLLKLRKAARHAWTKVEVYRSLIDIDLQKEARKGRSTKEILTWLADKGKTVRNHFLMEPKPISSKKFQAHQIATKAWK